MSTEECFKVVLVGGTNVGKSTILLRYVHDTFTSATIPTIGEFNIAIELNNLWVS